MKDFTGWRYYTNSGVHIGIMFTHSDGGMESRLLADEEVAAWLAAGNIPLVAI